MFRKVSRPMMTARPTMKDVAAMAGVGLKTVSRVVNGETSVSAVTAERVNAAIAKLGFRRNEGARLLRQGRTASIGLVLEDVADPFSSVLTRAVEEIARQHGSLVFASSSAEDSARERELTLAFCARRVDGLVIVPAGNTHRYLVPEMSAGIPAVFVDRPPVDIDADTVLVDNEGGARTAVQHLIAHGHRRIGFVGDSPQIYTAIARLAGYRTGLLVAGLRYDEELTSLEPPTAEAARSALRKLLDGPDPATALFCGNNRVTVSVLRELAARQPDRSGWPAVVGFDDFELADLLDPAVTVVAQDPAELGRTAAELLFGRLAGTRTGRAQTVRLPTRLIRRGSGEVPIANRNKT